MGERHATMCSTPRSKRSMLRSGKSCSAWNSADCGGRRRRAGQPKTRHGGLLKSKRQPLQGRPQRRGANRQGNVATPAESTSGRLHSWKWVWDGIAKDEATGFEAQSRGWKSQGGAKEHALDALFDVMFRNNLLA
mmetsp:Transcript_119441/g.337994  ORF Transcript_119441/g.337994 Transcript_119441/m.337994 type:complete len:135 (+) Transcript_119441:1388-1792(+)